jgi:hypothetical protein
MTESGIFFNVCADDNELWGHTLIHQNRAYLP